MFFKLINSSSLIGFGYNVLYNKYSRLNTVRYRLETGVDEVLDVLRYSEVLDVVEPVEPVVGAVKDWGLGSWRGYGEERSIYGQRRGRDMGRRGENAWERGVRKRRACGL